MLLVLRAPLRVEVERRRARPPLLAVGRDVDVDDSTRPRDRADRCDEERVQRTALAIGLGRVGEHLRQFLDTDSGAALALHLAGGKWLVDRSLIGARRLRIGGMIQDGDQLRD